MSRISSFASKFIHNNCYIDDKVLGVANLTIMEVRGKTPMKLMTFPKIVCKKLAPEPHYGVMASTALIELEVCSHIADFYCIMA